MDLEDKLKLLRKQKASRLKGEGVGHAWTKISRMEGLSTKEKLEKLISLTRTAEKPPAPRPSVQPKERPSFQVFEHRHALQVRYGRFPVVSGLKISGETLSLLGRDPDLKNLGLSTSLFLDLETTGLSGGVGTIPFLVGLAFFRDEHFYVVQYFLNELHGEEEMIEDIERFFDRMAFRSIVSFNGKAFDLPLLETRFVIHRKSFPLAELPHLDFLFPARSLWRHKHDNCRLSHLAREVLWAERSEDIPSAEIPMRYFQYLRTKDFTLIEPILYHNEEDLLSLLGVLIAGAMIVSEDEKGGAADWTDGSDMFGAAKLFEHAGDIEKSMTYLEKALSGKMSAATAVDAKKRLSYLLKKKGSWEKAIALWKDLTPANQLFCFKELAMYYEHKEKNYGEAIRLSEEGLAVSLGASAEYEKDFERRIERLKKKAGRFAGSSKKREGTESK